MADRGLTPSVCGEASSRALEAGSPATTAIQRSAREATGRSSAAGPLPAAARIMAAEDSSVARLDAAKISSKPASSRLAGGRAQHGMATTDGAAPSGAAEDAAAAESQAVHPDPAVSL